MTEVIQQPNQFEDFQSTLANVPEMKRVFEWAAAHPEEVTQIKQSYLQILTAADRYSSRNIDTIRQAREKMMEERIPLKSASDLDTATFLQNKRVRVSLDEIISDLFREKTESHKVALGTLAFMMQKGSELAAQVKETGKRPADGDTQWDEVIWGHTQAVEDVDPRVMVHFVFAHYICQFMNHTFGEQCGLQEKDDFINVLADVILHETARENLGESIYSVWSADKADGGLGWVTPEQLEVYKEIVHS